MTRLRADQLPAAVRRRHGLDTPRRETRREARGDCPGHCSCGQRFARFEHWERHVRDVGVIGHSRFDLEVS